MRLNKVNKTNNACQIYAKFICVSECKLPPTSVASIQLLLSFASRRPRVVRGPRRGGERASAGELEVLRGLAPPQRKAEEGKLCDEVGDLDEALPQVKSTDIRRNNGVDVE